MLSGDEWQNARRAQAILPAGQVTPSPKPFSPDGTPLKVISPEKWTPALSAIALYAEKLGQLLLDRPVSVVIADDAGWPYSAAYGGGARLTLNALALTRDAPFAGSEELDALLLHEFAHEYCGDHLSSEYHRAICRLGAKLKRLALAGMLPAV
jgi:hypothetical protein